MECLYCKKRIGPLQRIFDAQFCCRDHREKMKSRSARLLRDSGSADFYEVEGASYLRHVRTIGAEDRPRTQSGGAGPVLFGIMLLGLVYFASSALKERSTASAPAPPEATASSGWRQAIRSRAAVRFTDDFSGGMRSWLPASTGGREWSLKDGMVRPGSLRIFKESIPLTDYRVEFTGSIEQKALGWAYRARDGRNYYASKLLITKPGPLPSVDLTRYAVVNGSESKRVRLPLPMTVRPDTVYRVRMEVRGTSFSTTVNGQMVDTWSDARLASGGVGFFSETGEVAVLRNVLVANHDNLIGRILSHLGMVHPALLPRP